MNATTLNEATLYLRIPALTFLSVAMTIGILGHAAIVYVYGFRMRLTNVFLFINLLSLSDIISCVIAIPLEIYRIRMYYTYFTLTLCKIQIYALFTTYINSTCLLLIISVERYMRICRITSRQMEFSFAKKLGAFSAVTAALLAIPLCVWTETKVYVIDLTVVINRCSPPLNPNFYRYAIVVFGVSIPIWIVMLVLYIKIWRTLKRQANWNIEATTGMGTAKLSSMRLQMDRRLSKTNRSIICITFVFVCTCTFYFAFILINMISQNSASDDSAHYYLFLLNEAWVINIMFNPIVFGFMNEDFRMELFKLLRIKYHDARASISSLPMMKNRPQSVPEHTSSGDRI